MKNYEKIGKIRDKIQSSTPIAIKLFHDPLPENYHRNESERNESLRDYHEFYVSNPHTHSRERREKKEERERERESLSFDWRYA